jgi:hypothetical protein
MAQVIPEFSHKIRSVPGYVLAFGLAAFLLFVVVCYVYNDRANILLWLVKQNGWPYLIASFLLALLPAAICISQTVAKKRLLAKLDTVNQLGISQSAYFIAAQKSFQSIDPAGVNGDYLFPLLILVTMTFFLFLLLFVGFTFGPLVTNPNVFLIGIEPSTANFDMTNYQMGTFSVMSAAFLGNYIYTLSQLLTRVNNNDLFPISLHFYSARAIIAMTTACIFRHAFAVFGAGDTGLLLLLGFAAGLAPDLFIVTISRRAFQYLKIWGSRGDPSANFRPSSLALLEIDDLTRDKIDRLSELGIDSAHALSRQNPFIIWAKLPYDLGLVIDWIAQAQLYVIVRDGPMEALRKLLITDIFDFVSRLKCAAPAAVLKAAGCDTADAQCLLKQLESDEAYQRLQEVRSALLPENYLKQE